MVRSVVVGVGMAVLGCAVLVGRGHPAKRGASAAPAGEAPDGPADGPSAPGNLRFRLEAIEGQIRDLNVRIARCEGQAAAKSPGPTSRLPAQVPAD